MGSSGKDDRAGEWQKNISTGNSIMNVARNERIIRAEGGGLYRAEFWGDYSLQYPTKGPWRATLAASKADLPALRARGANKRKAERTS